MGFQVDRVTYIIMVLVKGGRQKGSHVLVKGGRQKGSYISALVKGNRRMGFQVD